MWSVFIGVLHVVFVVAVGVARTDFVGSIDQWRLDASPARAQRAVERARGAAERRSGLKGRPVVQRPAGQIRRAVTAAAAPNAGDARPEKARR